MEISTKAKLSIKRTIVSKYRAKEDSFLRMDLSILVVFMMEICMELVNIAGQMDKNFKANIKRTIEMVREHILLIRKYSKKEYGKEDNY